MYRNNPVASQGLYLLAQNDPGFQVEGYLISHFESRSVVSVGSFDSHTQAAVRNSRIVYQHAGLGVIRERASHSSLTRPWRDFDFDQVGLVLGDDFEEKASA